MFAVACGGDGGDGGGVVEPLPDGGATDFRVSGTLTGTDTRPGDFNGLFSVRIGPSSIHSYGLGRSVDGSTFTMNLPRNLPISALNGNTLGLATIIMTQVDDSISQGQAQRADLQKIIGVSPDHMLVYRSAPNVIQYGWESNFEAGWSCGLCQRGGQGAHTLTPVDCSTLVVEMGTFSTVGACNPFP